MGANVFILSAPLNEIVFVFVFVLIQQNKKTNNNTEQRSTLLHLIVTDWSAKSVGWDFSAVLVLFCDSSEMQRTTEAAACEDEQHVVPQGARWRYYRGNNPSTAVGTSGNLLTFCGVFQSLFVKIKGGWWIQRLIFLLFNISAHRVMVQWHTHHVSPQSCDPLEAFPLRPALRAACLQEAERRLCSMRTEAWEMSRF